MSTYINHKVKVGRQVGRHSYMFFPLTAIP